jgi:hypothetical protein
VIYGDLEMKSYSILRSSASKEGEGLNNAEAVSINGISAGRGQAIVQNNAIAAKLSLSQVKTAADPAWYLTPDVDNIHEFRAATNCVVLDCLLPPYSEPER